MSEVTFTMLIGISGSGKSTWINENAVDNSVVHSSDALREELFGDINDQSHNNEVFKELHKRIRADLSSGKNVYYDATNINAKRRISFLKSISDISCKKVAMIMAVPYECCLRSNWNRQRKIPDEVIRRQYMSWHTPYYFEGWDEIHVYMFSQEQIYYPINDSYNQNNPHHTHSLTSHMFLTYEYLKKHTNDTALLSAAILHDIGKPFCEFKDENGISHYYGHENVGAYDALTMFNKKMTEAEHIRRSALINYHMAPLCDSIPNYLCNDETFLKDIQLLSEADKASA